MVARLAGRSRAARMKPRAKGEEQPGPERLTSVFSADTSAKRQRRYRNQGKRGILRQRSLSHTEEPARAAM